MTTHNTQLPYSREVPKLFLDMDDCVTDWISEANDYLMSTSKIVDGFKIPEDEYSRLTSHTRFYRKLKLMPNATELVNWARSYATRKGKFLAFLTAIPHDDSVPYAAYDKSLWAAEHFPDIPVFFGPYSYDKFNHCSKGDILIDDRHENCMEWINAGGIAHIYTNWNNCKKWIRNVLKDSV